ncbi:cis-3-hydroxy-L-proline dehydratase [Rhizobium sp. RAF56]|uniref:cis-3-hydroxy-L-proline dehydratase n=1 Tax=Rhizobium sp. RAF56 TaxID=3233062 RepID=UPI003F94BFF3
MLHAEPVIDGNARGRILCSKVPLSFWGGVDPASGKIIDQHHPLCGALLGGAVLAMPSGRGSCSGSSVLLQLMLNGKGPAAFVFTEREDILTIGVIVARKVFERSIPVVLLGQADFEALSDASFAAISGNTITLSEDAVPRASLAPSTTMDTRSPVEVNGMDRALLSGAHGKAAQIAMEIVVEAAALFGATELLDVTKAHIDGCIYTGEASLLFAEKLCAWGARVRVPTTLNAISVDQRRWRAQGVDASFGEPASRLADAYVQMGAKPTFTCAPYLLDGAPSAGEQIAWAESNAVVYANSVLGARTMKYPDYLDICIALTGRAPYADCHLDAGRMPSMLVDVSRVDARDDAFFPLLGYHVGRLTGSRIPTIVGLERAQIDDDDLKAFGAAFATTSAAPMFHIAGITPECRSGGDIARLRAGLSVTSILPHDLAESWLELNDGENRTEIDLISLGNPHFSLPEFQKLTALCDGRRRQPNVRIIVTCGRETLDRARQASLIERLEAFDVEFITDTCWCMIEEPIIPISARTLMTNSGKYAHYGPGISGRSVRFGSLAQCVDAACTGSFDSALPHWLKAERGKKTETI